MGGIATQGAMDMGVKVGGVTGRTGTRTACGASPTAGSDAEGAVGGGVGMAVIALAVVG